MLRDKPHVLIIDDFPERGRVLGKILNSNGYCADSLAYPKNGIDKIEQERPDLLILNLDFSELSIIKTLQKIRENKPSLPIFICCDPVAGQLRNQAIKLGVSVFSPKAEVERILDQIENLSLDNKERELIAPSLSKT
jgi:DNA-binding NtrC family response regulator